MSGTNLVAKDAGGTSDPYVKVGFWDTKKNELLKAEGTKSQFKTDVVKKTLGPNWNFKGELQVGPIVVQNSKEIAFMVYVCASYSPLPFSGSLINTGRNESNHNFLPRFALCFI